MAFAEHYLTNHALFSSIISELPRTDLFISIVIPCYDEPDLCRSLESIWKCNRPSCSVEVLIVINASVESESSVINQNLTTYKSFINWKANHTEDKISFYAIVKNELPAKDAGVGLARKIGMDEAVRRFSFLNRPNGVIVGFDADSSCSENYLCEIEKHFIENPKTNGCSLRFEHPIEGNEFDSFIYNSIIQYELYLRYYIQALRYIKHPFAFHTIGWIANKEE